MNYLIAVYSSRIAAEEAYTTLEKSEIPTADVTILGNGYATADEFGFIDQVSGIRYQVSGISR